MNLFPILLCSALFLAAPSCHAEESIVMPSQTRLIASNGHEVAFHIAPGRLPAIVLDAGGGLDSTYWDKLVPEISKRTGREVITYDRAGFGASDEVRGPWNLQSATDDLANGLEALGATKGVILVSHSLAGEIATTLALRHPKWLDGAVLVDANVPEFFTDDVIAIMGQQYAPAVQAAKAAPDSKEARQLISLAASFSETSKAFHELAWPQAVPAIVIVSEQTPFDTPTAAQWWRDAHSQFVKGVHNRRLVVAERSSHDVVHDRPDVIIAAIANLAAGKP